MECGRKCDYWFDFSLSGKPRRLENQDRLYNPMTYLKVKVTGLDQLRDKFGRLNQVAVKRLQQAGEVAMKGIVLNAPGTPGNYPPATGANFPRSNLKSHSPMSYYERGKGVWQPVSTAAKLRNLGAGGFGPKTKRVAKSWGFGGYKLIPTSERLGTKYSMTTSHVYHEPGTVWFEARATYAEYVIGDRQSAAMKRIGWRRLWEVANENIKKIVAVYQKYVDLALKDADLK
jgi:hypothetical protein